MTVSIDKSELDKIILVGDRVLIRTKNQKRKTASGLYLPPTVQENEKTLSGYVVKTGPGYPIPAITDIDEPWKGKKDEVKYLPLQAKEGDLAVFINKNGWEIEFNKEKFIILPHSAILMLIRDNTLFE